MSRRKRARQFSVELSTLIAAQDGIISRSQLRAELSDQSIWWRIEADRWQYVLPGTYATFSGRLTSFQRVVAAAVYCGPGAQITGSQALRWHGFRYAGHDDAVHTLIPHDRRRRSVSFVVVERTCRLDPQPRRLGAVEMCGVARAVADTCRTLSSTQDARAVVAESVQRSKTTVAALSAELSAGQRRGSALLRRCVQEIAAGVRSAPEGEVRELLDGSRVLPGVLWNPRLVTPAGHRLPTPDGWIAEVGIAIEVDSREYHISPADWQRTLERHNELARHGILVLHFTPAQIRNDPGKVVATVERAYSERRRAGVRPPALVAAQAG